MELKEMENTGVIIETEDELNEFISICTDGGWSISQLSFGFNQYKNFGFYVDADKGTRFGKTNGSGMSLNLITLVEFKKEQGIMKYSAGDVLENDNGYKRKVLCICGPIYFVSSQNKFDQYGRGWTEEELEKKRYTLRKETTKTDKTVSEIEKDLGLAAGSLNVVADK